MTGRTLKFIDIIDYIERESTEVQITQNRNKKGGNTGKNELSSRKAQINQKSTWKLTDIF